MSGLPWQQIFKLGSRLLKSGVVNPTAVLTTVTSAVGGAGALAMLAARTVGGAWRIVTLPAAILIGAVGLTVEKRLRADEPAPRNSDAAWRVRERRELEQLQKEQIPTQKSQQEQQR
jgi:hypothetical protein